MKIFVLAAMVSVHMGFMQLGSGCAPDMTPTDDDTDMTDDTPVDGDPVDDTVVLTAVRTGIEVHNSARVAAGDDLVVFGTGSLTGVGYIIPSAGDTGQRLLVGGGGFDPTDFAVAGRTGFFSSTAFQVTVVDFDTGMSEVIPVSDIRLKNLPVSMYDPGNIQADGDYCITISEESDVDDGVIVKVIDVSDGSPTVIPLTTNPSTAAELVEQVAVDGETATAVAVADDSFHIYDINAPTAAPTVVAVANGIGDTQIAVDGGYILFHDDQSPSEIGLVNIATRAVTGLTHAAAAKELALAGGSFGYFVDRDAGDSVGNFQRSAFGTVPGPGATLAADDAFIDGGTTNNGLLGWGESIAVTPDGARWFIGGKTSVGSGEYLQTGTGGAFEVVEDPSGLDAYGCKGTDVSVSSNTVAFKIGLNTDTTLGYIVLP